MIKKLTALILGCVAISAIACGCAKKTSEPSEEPTKKSSEPSEEQTEYIGIISAMEN